MYRPIVPHEWGHCLILSAQYKSDIEVEKNGSTYTCLFPNADDDDYENHSIELIKAYSVIIGTNVLYTNKVKSCIAGTVSEHLYNGISNEFIAELYVDDSPHFWTSTAVSDKKHFETYDVADIDIYDVITDIKSAMDSDTYAEDIAAFASSLDALKDGESFVYKANAS